MIPGLDLFELNDDRHATESRLAELVSCLLHVSDTHVTAIVVLHVVFGMSYEDIAIICRRTPAACRQTARRALRKCFTILDADEPFEQTERTELYVQAILAASTAPLIDSLSVASAVTMHSVAASLSIGSHTNLQASTGRTRQVLVLSATGVQWALVLDSMVLCLLGSTVNEVRPNKTASSATSVSI